MPKVSALISEEYASFIYSLFCVEGSSLLGNDEPEKLNLCGTFKATLDTHDAMVGHQVMLFIHYVTTSPFVVPNLLRSMIVVNVKFHDIARVPVNSVG